MQTNLTVGWVAGPDLAAAVADAGGIGTIAPAECHGRPGQVEAERRRCPAAARTSNRHRPPDSPCRNLNRGSASCGRIT